MARRVLVFGLALVACLLFTLVARRDGYLEKPAAENRSRNEPPRVVSPGSHLSGGRSEAGTGAKSVGARIAEMLTADGSPAEQYLTPIEVAEYLEANRTNALSLVTVFEVTQDREFLKQAALAFPNDPFVQAKVLSHDLFPERRLELIEQFKKSAPENSLANFLSAIEKMKSSDVPGALQEIAAAEGKRYDDYTREAIAGLDEAYLSAGRPVAEAKALGSSAVHLPQLAPMKKIASELADLAVGYQKIGDVAAQQSLLEGAWKMGTQLREYGENATLLQDLVGLAMQNMALQRWPEGVEAPFLNGKSAPEKSAENRASRADYRESSRVFNAWLPQAPEHEIIAYYDRLRTFGENNAMTWVKSRHPQLLQSSAR